MFFLLVIIAIFLFLLVMANPRAAEGLGCLVGGVLRLALVLVVLAVIAFLLLLVVGSRT